MPRITRIFVRDLTQASEGSAVGIGQGDLTVQRLVDNIDNEATAISCLTPCCPESGRIPLSYLSDNQAVAAVLLTLRPYELDNLRVVHIKNSLALQHVAVSEVYLPELTTDPNVRIEDKEIELEFDLPGNLVPRFTVG